MRFPVRGTTTTKTQSICGCFYESSAPPSRSGRETFTTVSSQFQRTPKRLSHVIISGTGRAGTSYLVELLTNMSLDTGYTPSTAQLDSQARSGLELDIRNESAPYLVKSPWLCDYI